MRTLQVYFIPLLIFFALISCSEEDSGTDSNDSAPTFSEINAQQACYMHQESCHSGTTRLLRAMEANRSGQNRDAAAPAGTWRLPTVRCRFPRVWRE